MRFTAPARFEVDSEVFRRPPLQAWHMDYAGLLESSEWPDPAQLSAALPAGSGLQFVRQDAVLLADGLHYETRIATRGAIATRPENWHDLLNALIWLRYRRLKQALNSQQVAEIASVGPRMRSRVQCALTHFDEAGVMVRVSDPELLAMWDRHDWTGLFWTRRDAWRDGQIVCEVFGHALLEHALVSSSLLVGKALVVLDEDGAMRPDAGAHSLADVLAGEIEAERILRDPQELRPLPLSGIPGWHVHAGGPEFYLQAPCFRPLRAGRSYPRPTSARAAFMRYQDSA
ncbi:DUF3025 domain-containing protein [Frateuria aurantia]